MENALQAIRNIISQSSKDIHNISRQESLSLKEKKASLEEKLTTILKSVSEIIIREAKKHKYNPVVKFNSMVSGKKIIFIEEHFESIHKNTEDINYYMQWRDIKDEENNLHWAKCFPKGEERHIIIRQVDKETLINSRCITEKKINNLFECLIPDFSKVDRESDPREQIRKIIKEYDNFIEKFKNDIYSFFGDKKIRYASQDEIINYLFEPAVVMGWKEGFTATHEYSGLKFVSYIPTLYLFKKDSSIDFKEEREILVHIEGLYHEVVKELILLEQKFKFDCCDIADLNYRVWNTVNDVIGRGKFNRYRVLPRKIRTGAVASSKEEEDERDAYKEEISSVLKKVHVHIDSFCRRRNIWFILNYHSLFLESIYKDELFKARLNVICKPDMDNPILGEPKANLSWYGIFGKINDDRVLRLTKRICVSENILTKFEGKSDPIYKDLYDIDIPIGVGIEDNEDEREENFTKYREYCNKFKEALLNNNVIAVQGETESVPYFHNITGINYLEGSTCDSIAKRLFHQRNITGWQQCLIISSKYNVDFADSLEYFPNLLFFKSQGEFTDEDILFCKISNVLYVEVITNLLLLENDILLNRLEDLVDTKPQRIFEKDCSIVQDGNGNLVKCIEKIKEEDKKEEYIKHVKEIFDCFIEQHLLKIHPLIEKDLLLAFYLYWTEYFSKETTIEFDRKIINENHYLQVYPWNKSEFKNTVENWWKEFEKKEKGFDFKEFIYDQPGEKEAIEFERLDDDEFKIFVDTIHKERTEEFDKISIGNYGSLPNGEKVSYGNYLKNKLQSILKNMCIIDDNKKKEMEDKLGDGTYAAEYFSIFCEGEIIKTGYKYIYYIPSVSYDGRSFGGFSFFCKNKWPHNITKAALDWATRFGNTFAEIEGEKQIGKKLIEEGSKAAMTAIMARNLSHNIGSHVLSLLIQDMGISEDEYNSLKEDFEAITTKLDSLILWE